MHSKSALGIGAVLLGGIALSGCWESTDVTVHTPGEYKGTPDPLLQQDAATRQDTLRQRFELVQVDR